MRNTNYAVPLRAGDRAELRTLIGRREEPARLLTYARILLKANQGEGGPGSSDAAITGALALHPDTVARVHRTYVRAGLAAALAGKAPARVYPRKLNGAAAHLVAVACSEPPARRERWTLRVLADQLVRREVVRAVSYETVRRTLKQTHSSRG
jgi:hypothetical protein